MVEARRALRDCLDDKITGLFLCLNWPRQTTVRIDDPKIGQELAKHDFPAFVGSAR